MRRKILVYSDSCIYGGHEVTLCDAIEGLLQDETIKITVVIAKENSRLKNKLQGVLNERNVVITDIVTQPGDVFRALARSRKVKVISEIFHEHDPDLIMISQGAIGLSACGLAAAKMLRLPLVSFIPMAHKVSLILGKSTPDVWLQELCYRYLYALPDRFLTICTSTADMLHKQYGIARENIGISYYGLDIPRPPEIVYRPAGSKDRNVKPLIGLIGRVEFHQKRHDFFFNAVARSEFARELDYVVFGDGPDLSACQELTDSLGLNERVRYMGWVENVSEWYPQLDVVAIPSRFEGLPIVLIEALSYGLPVLASRVDGMQELLPLAWTFEQGNTAEMMSCLRKLLENDQTSIVKTNQDLAFSRLRKNTYQQTFLQNLREVLTDLVQEK